jgi:GNAT superfamily N-acetyltransferase
MARRVIGAALLALDPLCDSEDRLILQPIFVVPDWQRRGVATALLAEVFRRLQQDGVEVLRSSCSGHNAASKRWHRAVGMTEEIGFFARQSVFNWLRHELQRREFLSERKGIAFEREERLQLEAWLTSLATELNRLREEEFEI